MLSVAQRLFPGNAVHPVTRCVAFLCLVLLCGCDDDVAEPRTVEEALTPTGPRSGQQSPNARILPEPLSDPSRLQDADESGEDELPVAPRPRPKPERWPVVSALAEDELLGAHGSGYSLTARLVWPEVERRVVHQQVDYDTWPVWRIELAREVRDRPALSRWVIQSRVFPLPPGTEFRSRADRLGTVVVWPDQRSYRVAQPGAFRTIFQDRRVDRMPFVDAKVVPVGVGKRLGREVSVIKLETPLGVAHLDLLEVTDLPHAAPLFCRQVLELIRVQAKADLCRRGMLPVRLYIEWQAGGQMLFEVTQLKAEPDLAMAFFRTPPHLPIFKRGELPPFDAPIFPEEQQLAFLPLKKPGEPLAPPPPRPPAPKADELPPVEADPAALLPADMLVIHNESTRPLLVTLQKIPAFWLLSGQHQKLRVAPGPIRLIARDFLGGAVLDAGAVVAPREVRLNPVTPSMATAPAD